MFIIGWLRSSGLLKKAEKFATKAAALHTTIKAREDGTKEAIAALGSELKALGDVKEKVSKWLN